LLRTERLLLRKPALGDAEWAARYLVDPEVMRFIGGVAPVAELDPEAVVQGWLDRWDANGVGPFVLVRQEDGAFLGRCGFVVWDTRTWRVTTVPEAGEHAQPELGWTLLREHWGRGYATEAARAARAWGEREARVEHLISLIHPDNAASQRVAERLGAQPTRTVMLELGIPCVVWEHPRGEDASVS
jgi:RimJ/RimL family protein N-acetyltransferase